MHNRYIFVNEGKEGEREKYIINPRRACALVCVCVVCCVCVCVCVCVCLSVCLSVCVSVTQHLTFHVFIRATNDTNLLGGG